VQELVNLKVNFVLENCKINKIKFLHKWHFRVGTMDLQLYSYKMANYRVELVFMY
jgi:hypothetical protein